MDRRAWQTSRQFQDGSALIRCAKPIGDIGLHPNVGCWRFVPIPGTARMTAQRRFDRLPSGRPTDPGVGPILPPNVTRSAIMATESSRGPSESKKAEEPPVTVNRAAQSIVGLAEPRCRGW